MPTQGFTNQGFVFEDTFSDMAKRVRKASASADERVGQGLAEVFGVVERDLKSAIQEHPAWDSEIADSTSLRNRDGVYEVSVDDERAMHLETGRDPLTAPTPLVEPLLAQKADEINDRLSAAISRGVGL